MKAYERTCLSALHAVLKAHVPTTWYSIGKSQESAACMEEEPPGWVVYDYERGNRFGVSRYEDVIEACHELMHRVGGEWNDEFVNAFWQMWQTRDKK